MSLIAHSLFFSDFCDFFVLILSEISTFLSFIIVTDTLLTGSIVLYHYL